MKKLLNIALGIGFCLMFCFLAVGYAALNDELHVTGTVSYQHVESTEPTFPDNKDEDGESIHYGLFIGYATGEQSKDQNWLESDVTSKGNGVYEFSFEFSLDYLSKISSDCSLICIHCALPEFYNDTNNDQGYLQFSDNGTCDVQNSFGSVQKFDVPVLAEQKYTITITVVDAAKDEVTWKSDPELTGSEPDYKVDDDQSIGMTITSKPFVQAIIVTPQKGYLMPKTFTVKTPNGPYNIYTDGTNLPDGMIWNAETSTLYLSRKYLPTDGSEITVVVKGLKPAVTSTSENVTVVSEIENNCLNITLESKERNGELPDKLIISSGSWSYDFSTDDGTGLPTEVTFSLKQEEEILLSIPRSLLLDATEITISEQNAASPASEEVETAGFTLNTAGLQNIISGWYTANGCLNLPLTVEEGYLLPETMTVTINDAPYTVYTIPEGENPAGMGYDPIENILTIHFSLIPQDALITLVAEAIPEPEEEETEPTEEPTDPTEETTEPTEEPTNPTEEITESTEEPTDPTEETTEPTGEPTDPTEEITEHMDPTEETTEPTGGPMNPAEKTTEPTGEPMDPTEKTTEPTEESTDPTEETSTLTEECTVSADDGADSEHP